MGIRIIICLNALLLSDILANNVRIIGGQISNIRECPYLVSIRVLESGTHVCAGAIISHEHILTAGHCLYKKERYYSQLFIVTGTSTLSDASKSLLTVKAVDVHPEFYNKIGALGDFLNDIAVITVNEFINFNQFQNKIELPTHDILADTTALLIGWYVNNYERNENSENCVLQATVKVMKLSECSKYFAFRILNDCICTYTDGISAIKGDSGGPVTRNNKIVGIISFGNRKMKNVPNIHSNVYTHIHFIQSIISEKL